MSGETQASPSDQWKQNVQQKQKTELKHKLVGLAILATTMYMFREDLHEFSFKQNKVAYGSLIFGISEIFGWKIALGFMLGREITQLETWPELLGDSITDILAGGLGIIVSVKL
jgi:hypothetical protein